MADTLLGFGIFLLVAAIVGGGLKAFGFQVGPLNSIIRQFILASVGILMIIFAKFDEIKTYLIRQTSQEFGPYKLDSGESLDMGLYLNHSGLVVLVVKNIVPLSKLRCPQGGPQLSISLCSAANASCERNQVGLNGVIRRNLDSGPATLSVFNFACNPPITFEISVKHPE